MNADMRNGRACAGGTAGLRFSDGSGGVAMNAGTERVEHTGVAVWQ